MKKLNSNKKGQAALEFLTTYGWAFLVILVAIGGLSYFGVFDIGRILPDGCKLDTNLECGDIYVLSVAPGGDARFQAEFRNNRDKVITVTDMRIIEKGLTGVADNTGIIECADTIAGGVAIPPGSFGAVDFTTLNDGGATTAGCGIESNLGEKKTFLIEIDYTVQGSSIVLTSNGEVTTTVQ